VLIDRQLREAGWKVQDTNLDTFAGPGGAVCEVVTKPRQGRADLLLYFDRQGGRGDQSQAAGASLPKSKSRPSHRDGGNVRRKM
jgi:hypothetical protein